MRIFISSVQKELATERKALAEYLSGDPLLRRFFECFLFEDQPAADQRADQCYLEEVDRSDIYLGIFGNEYGWEDAEGVSPTHREFNRATETGKSRLIYVKGADDGVRHPKMRALINEAGASLIRRGRNFPLPGDTPPHEVLAHLNLLDKGRPTLTLEKLRGPHASVPHNPLLAESMYLTQYIERMGTGIRDMIRRCRKAGLAEPEIRIDGGFFVLTIQRKTSEPGAKPVQVTGTGHRTSHRTSHRTGRSLAHPGLDRLCA